MWGLSGVKVVGGVLLAIGLIALILGFIFSASPELVEKSVTVPHTEVLLDDRFTVGPLNYKYKRFSVPAEARTVYLDVSISVYSGNDIDFEVYRGSSKVFEVRVNGGFSDTINLPGPGSYELRFDNSYSILTPKDVEARVVLHWSEVKVERQEITGRGESLIGGGLILLITGAIVYAIGSKIGPKIETVDSVLLDLATRKPPESGGLEANLTIKLEPKGIGFKEVSKLVDVVAKARGVRVEASKPRFRSTYTLSVKGPKEAAVAAAKDVVEFCERTRKCKASLESS